MGCLRTDCTDRASDYEKKTRTITSLEIQDRFGNVRYSLDAPVAQKPTAKEPSAVVKARRAAAGRGQEQTYTPMSEENYWKIVEAYAQGKPTKTGGDYRQTWIETTHAGAEQIAKFDHDVENVRIANNLNL